MTIKGMTPVEIIGTGLGVVSYYALRPFSVETNLRFARFLQRTIVRMEARDARARAKGKLRV
jgi:hypothetical protein